MISRLLWAIVSRVFHVPSIDEAMVDALVASAVEEAEAMGLG